MTKVTGLKASTLVRAYVKAEVRYYHYTDKKDRNRVSRQADSFEHKLTEKLKAQEEELSVLKRQVEEFKPVFILQQLRAGNVTEVKNADD